MGAFLMPGGRVYLHGMHSRWSFCGRQAWAGSAQQVPLYELLLEYDRYGMVRSPQNYFTLRRKPRYSALLILGVKLARMAFAAFASPAKRSTAVIAIALAGTM